MTGSAYEQLVCECGHPVSAHDPEHAGYHHCRACCVPGALCIHPLRTIEEANADYRLSQEISGRATRALMESLRVCCGQPDTCERDCPLDGAA